MAVPKAWGDSACLGYTLPEGPSLAPSPAPGPRSQARRGEGLWERPSPILSTRQRPGMC